MPDLFVIEPFGRIPRWAVERPRGSYFGFFRNEFGERWVIVAWAGRVRLAGEAFGWEPRDLSPTAEDLYRFESCGEFEWPQDLPMNRDERLWLSACLASAAPLLTATAGAGARPAQ